MDCVKKLCNLKQWPGNGFDGSVMAIFFKNDNSGESMHKIHQNCRY